MLIVFISLLLILSLIDVLGTYYFISNMCALNPKFESYILEANIFPKFFIKKFGLKLGLSLHYILIFIIIISFISYTFNILSYSSMMLIMGIFLGAYLYLFIFCHIPGLRSVFMLKKRLKDPDFKKEAERYLMLGQEILILDSKLMKGK